MMWLKKYVKDDDEKYSDLILQTHREIDHFFATSGVENVQDNQDLFRFCSSRENTYTEREDTTPDSDFGFYHGP